MFIWTPVGRRQGTVDGPATSLRYIPSLGRGRKHCIALRLHVQSAERSRIDQDIVRKTAQNEHWRQESIGADPVRRRGVG